MFPNKQLEDMCHISVNACVHVAKIYNSFDPLSAHPYNSQTTSRTGVELCPAGYVEVEHDSPLRA